MKSKQTRLMCISGIFTALVFAVTAYLHIPTVNGYIHVGDGLIYLAACILPLPYAIAVSAGGALLADCLTGFAIWAPGSVLIKTATVFLFSCKKKSIVNLGSLTALLPSTVICAGGYYLYEALIYQNLISPIAGIPASLTQSVASSVLFIIVGLSADKLHLKTKIFGEN